MFLTKKPHGGRVVGVGGYFSFWGFEGGSVENKSFLHMRQRFNSSAHCSQYFWYFHLISWPHSSAFDFPI